MHPSTRPARALAVTLLAVAVACGDATSPSSVGPVSASSSSGASSASGGVGASSGSPSGGSTSSSGGASGGASSSSSSAGGGGAVDGGDDGGASDSSLPPWDGSFGDAGCAGDPTAGFTEYTDTFKVQFPYDLMQSDRFSFENGVYTTWIYPTDKPFSMDSPTGPRTEMRWLQNWSTGERMWEADVLVDSPTTHSCIMQVKSDSPSAEALYLQVDNGNLQNSVGPVIAKNVMDHWFHLDVAYDTATRVGRVWLNNCLIFTSSPFPRSQTWYFKNGVYGCDPMICRSHFQNVRFWQR